ncbi:MAG: endonuclease/exonuclease/phosphatase family protein [Phenylobacterium sp.]|uniref:endonuclease/exonuclease/phosphatase family protein n=1 Tax=Phenylobacterium sp. TaxID=1871053 RepID=UPI001A476A5E|nr:endonuclease/exonuclease/phosphatase family protein [Phenylobacterium sp.]MBL8770956.1 endonuclease/exonuclease/phosphatase family protein [Phenylobacterium sp.]
MGLLQRILAVMLWPLALAVMAVSLAAQGGRVSPHLDVLTHFALIYLFVALACLLGAALTPRRGRLALAGVALVGAAASGALVAPEFLPNPAEPRAPLDAPGQIKVIEFNAWSRNVAPERASAWLLEQAPDIIVMIESKQITDRLKAAGYQVACRGCGALIFTRQKAVWSAGRDPRDDRTRFLAAATFADPNGDFTVVGVHRAWPLRFERDRREAQALRDYMAPFPKERLILAGDFNSTSWSFARRRDDRDLGVIRRTRGLSTWPAAQLSHNRLPAPFPYLPIDHVYAGPGWATVSVERGPELGSDHYPVIVTLAPVDPVAD